MRTAHCRTAGCCCRAQRCIHQLQIYLEISRQINHTNQFDKKFKVSICQLGFYFSHEKDILSQQNDKIPIKKCMCKMPKNWCYSRSFSSSCTNFVWHAVKLKEKSIQQYCIILGISISVAMLDVVYNWSGKVCGNLSEVCQAAAAFSQNIKTMDQLQLVKVSLDTI